MARRLQVLAVVLSDGLSDGLGRSGSGAGGGGDAPASAGGSVVLGRVAVLDVGGNDLVVSALLKGLEVALELGGLISVNSDGDSLGAIARYVSPGLFSRYHRHATIGYLHSVGGDSGSLEAGAVGLASGAGEKVTTGTGNVTVAVVAVAAVTHLNGASHGHGGKGQNGEDLHLDWWFLSFWN